MYNTLKPYLLTLCLFVVANLVALLFRQLVGTYTDEELVLGILHRIILTIITLAYLCYYRKRIGDFFSTKPIKIQPVLVIIGLLGLFSVNNLVMVSVASNDNFEYIQEIKHNFPLFFTSITLGSIYEELMYRGFIQSYIDRFYPRKYKGLTAGNLFASSIMLLTHIGFFMVWSPLMATFSFLLVLIFSLSVGYIKTTLNSIWIVILIHLACNYIHTAIHLFY